MENITETDDRVLAALLRISAHLEGIQDYLGRISERLETIEELLRDFVEQNDEVERRWQRAFAALSLAAGNSLPHHDC